MSEISKYGSADLIGQKHCININTHTIKLNTNWAKSTIECNFQTGHFEKYRNMLFLGKNLSVVENVIPGMAISLNTCIT